MKNTGCGIFCFGAFGFRISKIKNTSSKTKIKNIAPATNNIWFGKSNIFTTKAMSKIIEGNKNNLLEVFIFQVMFAN